MIRCRSETAQGERGFSRSYTALERSPRTQRACHLHVVISGSANVGR